MVTLYDPNGRKIDLGALRQEESAPSLRSVRQVFSSNPSNGLTPQRLASIFKQADVGNPHAQCELFEEMEEKDLHLSSVIGTRKRALTGLEINIKAPENATAQEQKATDLVKVHIASIPDLPEKMEDILDAIGKGYSCTEIIWGICKQEAVIEDLRWREPKFFRFDQDTMSELRLLDPSYIDGKPLTPYKYIRHIHKAKSGIPVRGGIFRPCAWMYLFKNYSYKDWVQFAEVYAQPLRVGKYPSSASENEKNILLQAVANMGTDAAAIIPDSMLIEFVESAGKGSSSDLYDKLCRFCDEQVSKGVLGQTSSSDAMAGGLGSGQANLHGDVREDLKRADAKVLAGTLNRDVVRPLVDLNMGMQDRYPILSLVIEDAQDLKELSDNLTKLHALGLPIGEDFIYQEFNIPKPKRGETLIGADLKASTRLAPTSAVVANSLAPTLVTTPPDATASIAERLDVEAQAAQDAMIEQIRGLLNDASSLDEFANSLPQLLGDMNTKAITEIMAKAFSTADLMGQYEVIQENKA